MTIRTSRFVTAVWWLIALTSICPAICIAQTDHGGVRVSLTIAQTGQSPISAQFIDPVNGLTAEELVAYAISHNGELAAARAMLNEVRGRLRQAALKPNPTLETSGTKAVNSSDNSFVVGLELPLEIGGRSKARTTAAERELELREAEVRDFERRLAGETRSRYIEAIAVARNLKFAEELVRLDRDSHELVQARVDLGNSAPLERNQVWVELNRAEAALIAIESRMEQAVLELKRVAGIQPEDLLRLRGELVSVRQPVSQGEALRRTLEARPDLLALRAAERLAEAQADQARRDGRIDASIFANYQRMNFGFDIRGFDDSDRLVPVAGIFHYVTFGVRFTIPARNRNQGLIEAAMASMEAAQKRREFAEQVARNEVAAAYARYERSQSALDVYRDRVRGPAMENLEVVHKTYTLGYKTALDYLAEQRRFAEIETGYTEALKERLLALSEIERVTVATR
jgi:outer membrane protein, heavy metal efflux system